MIVSIGTEIAQQRIASPADIDAAVRIGLGYPLGPLAMGDALGPDRVPEILENLHRLTGDPRYRPGGWLRRRAQLGCRCSTRIEPMGARLLSGTPRRGAAAAHFEPRGA